MENILELVWLISLGVVLSASAGLRAFLPLFIVSCLAHFGGLPLTKGFAFLATDKAVIVFGVATLLEILADKFPAIDHALDTIHTFIKPVLSFLTTAAVMSKLDPLVTCVLAIAMAGGLTLPTHVVKASVRGLSSTTTGALLNPIISLIEDVGAIGLTAIATILLVPTLFGVGVLVLSILLIFALTFYLISSSRRRAELQVVRD